ncbi:hypothetical protein BDW02DRAFT_497545 [Decorospora gaudefroyi]|uniref:Mid2 domain-containing protein n=1 Tax=Decorospora gaudefroyi TaxID=184978 RepID=A0A6A5KA74_9PLEO|nr:hypothetical protein BDW02DRAFT_497545 [Decorospora gaudefroyi]
MARAHSFFHRRAAQADSQLVTVGAEGNATVDTNASSLAQPSTPQATEAAVRTAAAVSVETVAEPVLSSVALPVVPAVPSMPSVPTPVLPAVPSVPPFPTDLAVPPVPIYPFSSGASVPESAISFESAIASLVPTGAPESTVTSEPAQATIAAINSILNGTLSSTASFASSSSPISLSNVSSSSSDSLLATIAAVPSSQTTSASHASLSSTRSPSSRALTPSSTATRSIPAATTTYYGGGEGGNAAADAAATTAPTSDADAATAPAPLETPQVVGSVVGSLAGAALILAIILLFIRRHKRNRGGALQLTGDDHTDNNQSVRQAPTTSSALVPAAFLNRFSGMSAKTAETSTSAGERSFQRVSGRKLPSAFSDGMTSDQFSRGGTLSGSSFYQDDQGTYGGPGVSKEFGKETGDSPTTREPGKMSIRPSPARTPVIRHPEDANPFAPDRNHLSPPQSPNTDLPTRGTLGRSLPSADGSRSSRFTENV